MALATLVADVLLSKSISTGGDLSSLLLYVLGYMGGNILWNNITLVFLGLNRLKLFPLSGDALVFGFLETDHRFMYFVFLL